MMLFDRHVVLLNSVTMYVFASSFRRPTERPLTRHKAVVDGWTLPPQHSQIPRMCFFEAFGFLSVHSASVPSSQLPSLDVFSSSSSSPPGIVISVSLSEIIEASPMLGHCRSGKSCQPQGRQECRASESRFRPKFSKPHRPGWESRHQLRSQECRHAFLVNKRPTISKDTQRVLFELQRRE